MSLEYRTAYWDDRESREAFKRFVRQIHGLDFTRWEQAGFWDHAYRPFSYFEEGEVVSSVCIYSLPAVLDGRRTRLAQISGVGTLPSHRRRGLNRKLTDAGLDWAGSGHEGVFLFSDEDAVPYYRHCGFAALDEHLPTMDVAPVPRKEGAVPLGGNDLDRIRRYAETTAPVSERFSVGNWKLFMFHALYTLQGKVVEIPELGCLVCCERGDGRLQVYDVLGEAIPPFEEIHPYIADPADRAVDFHFHPDKMNLKATSPKELVGNNLFVRPGFPVREPVFPYTSRA